MLARGVSVDNLRKELLSDTALTRYKHGQIGRSNTQRHLQRSVQERRVADYAKSLLDRE